MTEYPDLGFREALDFIPLYLRHLDHPLRGIRGNILSQAIVDRGAKGIDIGPGTQIAPALVLLDGGIAMLQDGFGGTGQIFRHVRILHFPHGTEVQQLGLAVALYHDVVRRNVPVDQTRFMDPAEGIHNRAQDGKGLPGRQGTALHLDIALQVRSLHILHGDIGSIVLREIIVDLYDTGDIGQLGHGPGFPHEALPVMLEDLRVIAGAGHFQRIGIVAGHDAAGVILLNGQRDVQIVIPADVGDAEAALAQDFTHGILAPEAGAYGQLVGIIWDVFVVAAMLADRAAVLQLHAAGTPGRHIPTSFPSFFLL